MHINGSPQGKKCFYGNRFDSKPLFALWNEKYSHNREQD